RRVVRASERLLTGRTGVLIAHRLTTIERADHVAVLDHGRVIQQGRYADLAVEAGPSQELLAASKEHHGIVDGDEDPPSAPVTDATGPVVIGGVRRKTAKPEVFEPENGPGLARAVLSAFRHRPAWGLLGVTMFLVMAALSPQGIVTSWL